MSQIRDFLKTTNEGLQLMGMKKPEGWQYQNCYDFILQHGIDFQTPEPFPHLMEPKQCFFNSITLVSINEERYVYCEGMCLVIIPIQHAWVWDRWENTVVDPTLSEPAAEYCGVPFRMSYAKRRMVNNRRYALIDTFWDDFELLRDHTIDWLDSEVAAAM